MTNPTAADLLDAADRAAEALKAVPTDDLVNAGLAVFNDPTFRSQIARLETIAKALPDDNQFKRVFMGIPQGVIGAVAVAAQQKAIRDAASVTQPGA